MSIFSSRLCFMNLKIRKHISLLLSLVFIDEESCIGCSQCATIAPASFKMLEDTGRARTFYQRNTDEIEHAVSVSEGMKRLFILNISAK